MRDAFGGVFMMRLILVFIFIYVGFTALSLNYAKAFRIKNSIIDVIEENEITDLRKIDSTKIEAITKKANYNKTCVTEILNKANEYCHNGIVIIKENDTKINEKVSKRKYTIKTYADWNVGFLNKILALGGKKENSEEYVNGTWTISGEAEVIVKK